jgi:hypothetical protein
LFIPLKNNYVILGFKSVQKSENYIDEILATLICLSDNGISMAASQKQYRRCP